MLGSPGTGTMGRTEPPTGDLGSMVMGTLTRFASVSLIDSTWMKSLGRSALASAAESHWIAAGPHTIMVSGRKGCPSGLPTSPGLKKHWCAACRTACSMHPSAVST